MTTALSLTNPGRQRLACTLAGDWLYFNLFYKDAAGINLFLWALFLISGAAVFQPAFLSTRLGRISALYTLFACSMVVCTHTTFSIVIALLSFAVLAGAISAPNLNNVMNAAAVGLKAHVVAPARVVREGFQHILSTNTRTPLRLALMLVIPVSVVILFMLMFHIANPVFAGIVDGSLTHMLRALEQVLAYVSIPSLLCIAVGIKLAGACLYTYTDMHLQVNEAAQSDFVSRIRQRLKIKRKGYGASRNTATFHGLRTESRIALMLLLGVNVLLLTVNCIDFFWLWVGFHPLPGQNLSQLVHEGTYVLIYSILLSMGIMLVIFRGKQHFHSQNKFLKLGCYAWLVQNLFLAASVAMRNYHYISMHGLAYKRIGVLVFLALVGFGLFTLALKIQQRRSLYYLLRTNAFAVYTALVLLTGFDWDRTITNYNLTHRPDGNIDAAYLMQMSDETLPLLWQHRERLILEYTTNNYLAPYSPSGRCQQTALTNPQNTSTEQNTRCYVLSTLEDRIHDYLARERSQSWRAFNLPDWQAVQYLTAQPAFANIRYN